MRLRSLTAEDGDLLERATLENVNWEREQVTLDQVRAAPELAHYTQFVPGRGDFGVVAERDGEPVGVAWAIFLPADDPGYGFIDDAVPELALWVRADVRGRGVGRRLLRALKDTAAERGLAALSLSVEDGNHARHLYESEGFADVPGREADGVMLWRTGTLRITHRLFDPAHLAATGQSREMTRARAAELGHETLIVIERASEPIAHAIAAKRSIPPDEPLPEAPARRFATTAVELTNETTLGAARRLTAVDERPLALNFANGLHPGGGWLSGARPGGGALPLQRAVRHAPWRPHVRRPRGAPRTRLHRLGDPLPGRSRIPRRRRRRPGPAVDTQRHHECRPRRVLDRAAAGTGPARAAHPPRPGRGVRPRLHVAGARRVGLRRFRERPGAHGGRLPDSAGGERRDVRARHLRHPDRLRGQRQLLRLRGGVPYKPGGCAPNASKRRPFRLTSMASPARNTISCSLAPLGVALCTEYTAQRLRCPRFLPRVLVTGE